MRSASWLSGETGNDALGRSLAGERHPRRGHGGRPRRTERHQHEQAQRRAQRVRKISDGLGDSGARSEDIERGYDDAGGASRFFYVAKAPKRERPDVNGVAHPTVKPLALMRWLVRLVTPPGGTVLEPFAGSGATVEACIIEGFHCIAIEREAEYLPLIRHRIDRNQATEPDDDTDDELSLFDIRV